MPAEPIEATAAEDQSYTPSVPSSGPDRADVLTQARKLAAECNGVAALVEQNVFKLRGEFTDAWRCWYGTWLGRHIYLERMPFKPGETDAEVARWQQRLATWRAGLNAELGTFAPAAAGPQPVVATEPPRRGWPWWAKWLGIGGGVILVWKVGQWLLGPSYSSTAQVVSDVAQTADAVNGTRKGRQ